MRRALLAMGLAVMSSGVASAQTASVTAPPARSQSDFRSVPALEQMRPLRLEDYYRMKGVGSPRMSPDGEWVTYTVSLPIEETNGDATESWLVRTSGSAPAVRIERNGQDVSDPGWTEDGRLRFSHDNQTWTADPARPAQATRVESETPEGVLSPDGRYRARTRRMAAPAKPPSTFTPFEQRHEERFEGDAFDWYPFRQDGQRFPLPDRRETPPSEIFIEAVDGNGGGTQVTRLGLQPNGLRWTPDGSAVVFTANEGILEETSYGATDMFRVTVDGVLTRLTDDGYGYSNVDFSPDGRWMSYVRSFGTDLIIELKLNHGGPRDIYLQPAGGGEPVNLTEDWDLDPGSPQWSPDSRYLYFTAGIGGASHLFRVPAAGGPVEQVTTGERRINGLDIDRSFRRMTYTVGEFDRPSDVWVADIDGQNERRLTDVHAEFLAEVQLATRPSESVRYKSYDGTDVEGFLIYPHGYDPQGGPYPLIVMNHGGPHSASGYGFNFKNTLFAANGYFVFLPNFRSSTGYGDDFKWGTWGAWGDKDGEDVLSGVDHLIQRQRIDRDRVGTTGHSYGGIMTNWLITRYPDRFRAAIPGAGESNWFSNYALSDISRTKDTEFFGPPWDPRARDIMIKQSAYLNSGGVKAATLFIHGEVDYRVPLEGAIQLYTSLKKQGVPTKMIIYEGMPHGIRGHWNGVHRMMHELRWWETYLKPSTQVRANEG
jgi:dipeptidyl aminopeptidase/acylaminoacyl peptidase